jgi:hypothetical protein
MTDEIILWRYRLSGFITTLGKTATERVVTGLVSLATLAGLIALFYAIGQYASLYETNYRWVSLGLAFVVGAGFLGHIRSTQIQQSFIFLPISPKTLTWHGISAGLRFPVLVGALLVHCWWPAIYQPWPLRLASERLPVIHSFVYLPLLR